MVDTVLFWSATAVYVTITLFLAYFGWKKTKKGEDFLLAGRKVNPWIIGLSYGSTFISTAAIVGFGGVAANWGLALMWLVFLNIAVGILIAFIVFGKPTRKLGQKYKAMTFPDLLGKVFRSKFLRVSAALIIVVMMPLYASGVLIGGTLFIQTTLGVDYNTALIAFAIITAAYVLFGGLLAVMYTDAFQGAIMLFGMTAILILTFLLLGGVTDSFQALTDLPSQVPPTSSSGTYLASLASKGWEGWTSFPELGSSIWFTVVTTIIMGVGIGVLAQPQLVVRFMTAKDAKTLNRAVPIGALFILLTTGVAYTVGALTNVYFWDNEGMISTQVVKDPVTGIINIDKIVPQYINSAMPDIIIIIFMLTLLAAAMSTLSSLFHTMGSAAGFDIYSYLKGGKTKEASLKASRIGTLVMIVASVVLAFFMPVSIIARATAMFMGLCASAFLPLFVHGLFSKRTSRLAAISSLVVGTSVWFFWTFFVHKAESAPLGICNALFGVDSLLGMPWQVVDPLIVAIPCSVAALVVGYALDKQKFVKEEADAASA
ncbi:MAG: sodium:solute symporter family protein [Methanomassiliicoccales archaeon]|nr:sodium:solute symporter family protein [Methanomassiliicoccales archaeon]MDD1756903.1 sodium:solute symporter family protein [Methanomassiliicoccales archaeon]